MLAMEPVMKSFCCYEQCSLDLQTLNTTHDLMLIKIFVLDLEREKLEISLHSQTELDG